MVIKIKDLTGEVYSALYVLKMELLESIEEYFIKCSTTLTKEQAREEVGKYISSEREISLGLNGSTFELEFWDDNGKNTQSISIIMIQQMKFMKNSLQR